MDVLINLTAITISKCMCILNHPIVHLKYTRFFFNRLCISVKLETGSRKEHWDGVWTVSSLPICFLYARIPPGQKIWTYWQSLGPLLLSQHLSWVFVFPFTMLACSWHSNLMCVFFDRIWAKNKVGVIVEVPASHGKSLWCVLCLCNQ